MDLPPRINLSNVTSAVPPTSGHDEMLTDPLVLKWMRLVFYSIICIVGTIGNALVILAYRNPRMRSVTNLFIANLGVADLTVTMINVPFTVAYPTLDYWPFGEFLCKVIPFILGVTLFSSVGTLIAIAADRYRAIVHPLLPRIRTRHALLIIAAIWTVAFIYPIPLIVYQKYIPEVRSCEEEWPSPQDQKIFTVMVFVSLYVIPLIVISVLYFLICHNLKTSESDVQTGANRAKKSVIRMLVVVVVLFTVCWLPYHISTLCVNFIDLQRIPKWYGQLHFFTVWMMFANSCCNPVVYAVLNRNYRREFVRLLRCQSMSNMFYRNSDSTYDRHFSSDTRTFFRSASGQVNKNLLKRKGDKQDDVSMMNGTTQMTSSASRSTRGSNQSNTGSGFDKQLVCIESSI